MYTYLNTYIHLLGKDLQSIVYFEVASGKRKDPNLDQNVSDPEHCRKENNVDHFPMGKKKEGHEKE
jgi:hypothetical protein